MCRIQLRLKLRHNGSHTTIRCFKWSGSRYTHTYLNGLYVLCKPDALICHLHLLADMSPAWTLARPDICRGARRVLVVETKHAAISNWKLLPAFAGGQPNAHRCSRLHHKTVGHVVSHQCFVFVWAWWICEVFKHASNQPRCVCIRSATPRFCFPAHAARHLPKQSTLLRGAEGFLFHNSSCLSKKYKNNRIATLNPRQLLRSGGLNRPTLAIGSSRLRVSHSSSHAMCGTSCQSQNNEQGGSLRI